MLVMAEVILNGITKTYPGGLVAVRNFDLNVADGEFVVLVGPSGSGKTTILRVIAGLEKVSQGTIRIGNVLVNNMSPKERDVAMVFQNYALYPHMSVYGNMAFALKMRRLPKQEITRRVRKAADVLGIADLLDRKPATLSGGQRQRVAVGRVMVRQAKVFLFDEPFSNLDARLRVEMRGELKRLHQQLGTTTIYVTHDQEEAMAVGQRIVVLKDGLIQQWGGSQEVYANPNNRFVAEFIGMPPMNFFDGALVAKEGRIFFDEGTAEFCLPKAWSMALQQWVDKDVVLGVRPEDMSICPRQQVAGQDNILPVSITLLEPLGAKTDLHARTGKHAHIVVRIGTRCDLDVGQQIYLHINMRKAHVFEPGQTAANITASVRSPNRIP